MKRTVLILLIVLFFALGPGVLLGQAQNQLDDIPSEYCVRCSRINNLAWSPKGDQIAVGASDGLWLYGATGGVVARLSEQWTPAVGWNADGTLLVSFSDVQDRIFPEAHELWRLNVWDVPHRRLVRQLRALSTHPSFSWSPNGNVLAYANGSTMSLWDADSNTIRRAANLEFERLPLLEASWPPWPTVGSILEVKWSPDGARIALLTRGQLVGEASENANSRRLLIWNVPDEKIEWAIVAYPWVGGSLTWSPSGTLLLDFHYGVNTDVGLIDIQTGQVKIVDLERPSIAAWDPTGIYVAKVMKVQEPGFIYLMDPQTWKTDYAVNGLQTNITALAWSPDGRWIASGDDNGSVWIWPVEPPSRR